MIFADTNVLVYASDPAEERKCRVAVDLLREAVHAQSLVLSTQVLQEFYATVLRKRLLEPADALKALRTWSQSGIIVPASTELLLQAAELQQRLRISYWDALVVQAALQSGCTTLFTEDLHHGLKVGELEVVNPFLHAVHEDRPPYLAGSSADAVDKVLRQAIARQSLVSLVYEGRPKEGEPHDYGRINGRLRLNFFQTKGRSRTGAQESGVWKTLDTGKIAQLRMLERPFAGTRSAARGAHKRWDELIASVTPRQEAGRSAAPTAAAVPPGAPARP